MKRKTELLRSLESIMVRVSTLGAIFNEIAWRLLMQVGVSRHCIQCERFEFVPFPVVIYNFSNIKRNGSSVWVDGNNLYFISNLEVKTYLGE